MAYSENDRDAQIWAEVLRKSLSDLGLKHGENIWLEYRWAPSREQIPQRASELVQLKPDVLVAGATPALAGLRQQTAEIPIIFANVADPVGQGFVVNLARPNGNATGFGAFDFAMGGKWIELIRDLLPHTRNVLVIYNPDSAPFYRLFLRHIESAASGIKLHIAPIVEVSDINSTLGVQAHPPDLAVIVIPGAMFTTNRLQIINLIRQRELPAVYPYRFWVKSGGLMSYGVDADDLYRRAAVYVHRVFNGEKIEHLPLQQPTKLELIVNLSTARDMKIVIPETILVRADEVIE